MLKPKTNLALAVAMLAAATALGHPGTSIGAERAPAGDALVPNQQIAGTWRLDLIHEEDAGGMDLAQFGSGPRGIFMADRAGDFSFQIMSSDGRISAANGVPAGMAPGAGSPGAMAYFGIYAADGGKLTLHVAACSSQDCDTADRTTEVKISGDTMEFISAAETSPTGASYSHIVWKRACCD